MRFPAGAGRQQKLLAAQLGITKYPTPAGGCMLTDPNLASRIKHFYNGLFSFGEEHAVADLRLLAIGRQFKLADDIWFILGRDERENTLLETLRGPDDWVLRMTTRPGPLGLLRRARQQVAGSDREAAIVRQLAGLVIRYGKKIDGVLMEAEVMIDKGTSCEKGWFAPLADAECDPWRI